MNPTIKCPACDGSGRAPLPYALQETLDLLPKRGHFTAMDILEKIPRNIKATAVNNRLEDLRALDFLTRERSGKYWLYSRKAEKAIARHKKN